MAHKSLGNVKAAAIMMVVSGVISHHGRRPCIFTIPLEMKEKRSGSHLIVH